MSRVVYVNGYYMPEDEAQISIFDRGFLFGDAIYEVCLVIRGQLIDNQGHLRRLTRSLGEVDIEAPLSMDEIVSVQRELIAKNDLDEGLVYLQITRGTAADRQFACPAGVAASVVMFTQSRPVLDSPTAETGLAIIFVDDIRWRRRDIKSVGLLAPVLAMHAAKAAGCDDAWLVEDDLITEGSNNNAFIVTDDDRIVTRHLSNDILSGITREAVLSLTAGCELSFEERTFSKAEVFAAREAFITSATSLVMPVVRVDGQDIGPGKPGPVSRKLRQAYIERALAAAARGSD